MVLAAMPSQAAGIMRTSIDLYRRVARLDESLEAQTVASPAKSMIDRLAGAF